MLTETSVGLDYLYYNKFPKAVIFWITARTSKYKKP